MVRLQQWAFRSVRVPKRNGTVTIQRARVRRVTRYKGALIFGVLFCYVARSALTSSLVPKETRDRLKALSKQAEDLAAKQKKSQEEQLDKLNKDANIQGDRIKIKRLLIGQQPEGVSQLFWVPIPLWTIKTRSPNYKPADPEWKAFLKLEDDSERMHEVKNHVAREVATMVEKVIPLDTKKTVGFGDEIPYSVKHIEVVFPLGPQDLCERPGLLIGSSSIAFGTKTLPGSQGGRSNRIFYPTVFMSAFYAGGQAFFKHHYTVLTKKLVGSNVSTAKPMAPGKVATGFTAAEKEQLDKSFGITKAGDKAKGAIEGNLRDEAPNLLKMLLPSPDKDSALGKAVKAYQRRFANLQIAALMEQPHGSCVVTGYVDLYGSRGTIRVHVAAIYVPSQDAFLGRPAIDPRLMVIPKVGALTAEVARREKQQKIKPALDKIWTEATEVSDRSKAHQKAREAHKEKLNAFQEKREAVGKKLDGKGEKQGGDANRTGSESGETDSRHGARSGRPATERETAERQQLPGEADALAAEKAKPSDNETKLVKERDGVLAQSDAILEEAKGLSKGNPESKKMKLKAESEKDSTTK